MVFEDEFKKTPLNDLCSRKKKDLLLEAQEGSITAMLISKFIMRPLFFCYKNIFPVC